MSRLGTERLCCCALAACHRRQPKPDQFSVIIARDSTVTHVRRMTMSDRNRVPPANDGVDTTAGSSPDPAEGKGPLRGLPPFPDLLTGNDAEGVEPRSGSPAG